MEYLQFLKGILESGKSINTLVVVNGGYPSSLQRQQLADLAKLIRDLDDIKVAVVTDSAIARCVVTAMNWFVPVYRSFSTMEMGKALDFLNVSSAASVSRVRTLVRSFLDDLDANAEMDSTR